MTEIQNSISYALIQIWWQITMAYMDLDNLWYKTPEIQLTLPSVMCRLSTVKTGQKMASLLLHMMLDQMQKCDQNTFSLSDPKIVKERTIKKKTKTKSEI